MHILRISALWSLLPVAFSGSVIADDVKTADPVTRRILIVSIDFHSLDHFRRGHPEGSGSHVFFQR
jgi:hypothetical protein